MYMFEGTNVIHSIEYVNYYDPLKLIALKEKKCVIKIANICNFQISTDANTVNLLRLISMTPICNCSLPFNHVSLTNDGNYWDTKGHRIEGDVDYLKVSVLNRAI